MTVAYAMSDLAPGELIEAGTVSVPPDRGGCGQQHHIKVNPDHRPYIDCPACAEYMVGNHYGWANTPHGVPLTPDEQGEVEISKRDGETSYRLAMRAMGDAVGQIVQGNRAAITQAADPGAAATTLKAQLAGLSADERAELRAMLAGEEPKSAPAPVVETVKTPARKPGRPRTTGV